MDLEYCGRSPQMYFSRVPESVETGSLETESSSLQCHGIIPLSVVLPFLDRSAHHQFHPDSMEEQQQWLSELLQGSHSDIHIHFDHSNNSY